MFLAIDIGNTSTTFGLKCPAGWRTTRRDTPLLSRPKLLKDVLCELIVDPRDIHSIGIASVVPPLDEPFAQRVEDLLGRRPRFVTASMYDRPIQGEHPQEIGADRLADAAGALAKFSPPLIVVDFGTATTFEYVDAVGMYRGGPILPGIMLMARALTAGTAKLPPIEFAPVDMLCPATTIEAMQSGLFHTTIGAVNHIVEKFQKEIGDVFTLIATGGFASLIVPHLKNKLLIEPTLTLDGIYACLSSRD